MNKIYNKYKMSTELNIWPLHFNNIKQMDIIMEHDGSVCGMNLNLNEAEELANSILSYIETVKQYDIDRL